MKKEPHGFSLIELMLALAIAGILLAFAVPGFNDMLQNNRLTTQANSFVLAVHFARSEAVKRGEDVLLVAADPTAVDDEWGPGWTVETTDGTALLTGEALEGGATLNSTGDISTYTYEPNGRVDNPDTLQLCDSRNGETGRELTVLLSGRVTVSDLSCS